MIFKRINAVFNPECYHGWGINKRFFEGWYFKIISSDQNFAYAFIPGIAMDKNGKKQSFIQVLDGKKFTSDYYKFNFNDSISVFCWELYIFDLLSPYRIAQPKNLFSPNFLSAPIVTPFALMLFAFSNPNFSKLPI